MKKLSYILSVGLLSTGLFSCGGGDSALDIKVEDLESSCDFVDALHQVSEEMVAFIEDGELSDDEKETFTKLQEKGEEIDKIARDKFERSEAEQCKNWEEMRKQSEKLEPYM